MSEGHEEELHRIRHSASHVMAQAVLETFPGGKIAIGPAIEDGFYYDFDLPRTLLPEDLDKIEARMREIVREDYPFVYREVSADEARVQFKDQPYKVELINDSVDLTPYLREDIFLAFPQHPLCKSDCRGLAARKPETGRRVDSPQAGASPWAALDKLKLDNQ